MDHHHFDKAFQVYRFAYIYYDKMKSTTLIIFRSRYNNKRNEIVFLALSDDYHWIKVGLEGKK